MSEGNECAICLDSLESRRFGEVLCGHKFHLECLDGMEVKRDAAGFFITCPLCRAKIPPISEVAVESSRPLYEMTLLVSFATALSMTGFWLLLKYSSM